MKKIKFLENNLAFFRRQIVNKRITDYISEEENILLYEPI
jgi:hypothetical protein